MHHYHSVFLLEIPEHLSSIFLSVSRASTWGSVDSSSLNNRDSAGHMSETFPGSCGESMWNQAPTPGLQTLNLGFLPQWARLSHFWQPFGPLVELITCSYLLWGRYCFYSIKQWLITEALQECSRTEEIGGHSTLLEFLELSFCHTLCILQMFFLSFKTLVFQRLSNTSD